jgi:hypothetical protein
VAGHYNIHKEIEIRVSQIRFFELLRFFILTGFVPILVVEKAILM